MQALVLGNLLVGACFFVGSELVGFIALDTFFETDITESVQKKGTNGGECI
jgi:hypothetical protein